MLLVGSLLIGTWCWRRFSSFGIVTSTPWWHWPGDIALRTFLPLSSKLFLPSNLSELNVAFQQLSQWKRLQTRTHRIFPSWSCWQEVWTDLGIEIMWEMSSKCLCCFVFKDMSTSLQKPSEVPVICKTKNQSSCLVCFSEEILVFLPRKNQFTRSLLVCETVQLKTYCRHLLCRPVPSSELLMWNEKPVVTKIHPLQRGSQLGTCQTKIFLINAIFSSLFWQTWCFNVSNTQLE